MKQIVLGNYDNDNYDNYDNETIKDYTKYEICRFTADTINLVKFRYYIKLFYQLTRILFTELSTYLMISGCWIQRGRLIRVAMIPRWRRVRYSVYRRLA